MGQNPYDSPRLTPSPATSSSIEPRVRLVGLILAGLFFFASLGNKTISPENDKGFLLGFVCLLFGMGYLAWYANPFIFLSGLFLFLKQPLWATVAAGTATALALSALQIKEILVDESGGTEPVDSYGVGFYLWIGTCAVLLATSLLCLASRARVRVSS